MVRIRLQRMGRRHVPFYRLNAIEKTVKRDGKVLENLGWYDPTAKDKAQQLNIKEYSIKDWLQRGAQPSDTVMDMLAKRNLVDAEAWAKVRQSRVDAKKKYAAMREANPLPAAKK